MTGSAEADSVMRSTHHGTELAFHTSCARIVFFNFYLLKEVFCQVYNQLEQEY